MINLPYDVSKDVKFKVNEVLGNIITFFIELGEDSGDFNLNLQYIFPSFLVRKDINKCRNIVYEIQEYINDGFIHDLEPLYEYALYHLVDWYIDGTEEEDEILIDTSNIMLEKEDDQYIIENLKKLESYKEFLFSDYDFLDVANFINIYFIDANALKRFNIDLNKYIELMPDDIRGRYLKTIEGKKPNEEHNLEGLIVRIIYSAIKQKEHDPKRLRVTTETQLSDDIAHILQTALSEKDVITAREQPSGFALKSTGELDFYVYSQINHTYKSIAIGENKEWGNYQKQFKQLIGYMNENIEFGFTILFNKNTKLNTVQKRRDEFIKDFYVELDGERHFKTIETIKGYKDIKDVLISKHKNPENETVFNIYHFIVNAHRPEREESARQARM